MNTNNQNAKFASEIVLGNKTEKELKNVLKVSMMTSAIAIVGIAISKFVKKRKPINENTEE